MNHIITSQSFRHARLLAIRIKELLEQCGELKSSAKHSDQWILKDSKNQSTFVPRNQEMYESQDYPLA